MRTTVWIIGGVILLALQLSLAPRLALWGARPDWLLVAVIFFALHGNAGRAALGAWCLGFAADQLTLERPGLLALTYLGASLLTSALREYVFRMSVATQFFLTLTLGVVVRGAWLAYRRLAYEGLAGWGWDVAGDVLWGAAYTALFAPLLHRLLMNLGRPMGMRFPRYSHAGMRRPS